MTTITKSVDSPVRDDEGAAAPEPPAARAGDYVIVSPIAAGGGGSVWLARRDGDGPRSPSFVAVKFLHPDAAKDATLRRRFLREAAIAAAIVHPNVVEVIAVGDAANNPYLVMPFVKGTTVRQLLRLGPMPLDVALTVASDALRGLGAAHGARAADGTPLELVHRDISPHNLLVGDDGVTKLTDFGIARPALDHGASTTRWAQGKVSYFSPEQGRGEPLDQRSDLFAMGIVLWECLTGKALFRADDPFVTAHRVQTTPIPPVSSTRKDVGPELEAVIARALARTKEERFASAAEMSAALVAAAAAAGVALDHAAVASRVASVVAGVAPPIGDVPMPSTQTDAPTVRFASERGAEVGGTSKGEREGGSRVTSRRTLAALAMVLLLSGGVIATLLRVQSDALPRARVSGDEESVADAASPVTSSVPVATTEAEPLAPEPPASLASTVHSRPVGRETPRSSPRPKEPRMRKPDVGQGKGEPRLPVPKNPF